MQSYDILFMFAFLPVYMGLFAITPAKHRALVMTLGNAVTAVFCGLRCAAVYALCTAVCYFSGIAIYNMRNNEQRTAMRKALAAGNFCLAAAALVICSPRGVDVSAFTPFKAAVFSVLPLNMISYIADVFRGDCEAQTNAAQLAAYLGFFPSAGYGPVYRYKTVRDSFAEPRPDASKLALGIRYYIMGLAAYTVVAVRLSELHGELLATSAEQLSGGAVWMGTLVFYAGFGTSVIASLFMGHGLAVMQGIRSGHCLRRKFMQPVTERRLKEFNIPLCRWLKDYVTMPLRRAGFDKYAALSVSILLGALWYGFTPGWLAAEALLAAAVTVQGRLTKHHTPAEPFVIIGSAAAKLITFAAVSCAAVWEFISGKAGFALFRTAGADDGFFYTFFGEALIPTLIGLVIAGSLLHSLVNRMNLRLFKLVLPLAELVFLAIAAAYMVR
ncbi:MAG: hypothetical protein IIZ73_00055 [Ruminococcus sp.]|nr:hypothetical protein [Ruminococcus sp.]